MLIARGVFSRRSACRSERRTSSPLEPSAAPQPQEARSADDSSPPGEVAAVDGSQLLAAEVACSQPAGAPDGSQPAAQTADGSPVLTEVGTDAGLGEVMVVELSFVAAAGSRSAATASFS